MGMNRLPLTASPQNVPDAIHHGMVYTVHTFGRDPRFKPHVHLVLTKGGLKDNTWVEIDELLGNRLASKMALLALQGFAQGTPP